MAFNFSSLGRIQRAVDEGFAATLPTAEGAAFLKRREAGRQGGLLRRAESGIRDIADRALAAAPSLIAGDLNVGTIAGILAPQLAPFSPAGTVPTETPLASISPTLRPFVPAASFAQPPPSPQPFVGQGQFNTARFSPFGSPVVGSGERDLMIANQTGAQCPATTPATPATPAASGFGFQIPSFSFGGFF